MPDDSRDPMEIAEERIAEAKRTGATKLDLSWLNLTAVPESLGQLTNVTDLDLTFNELTTIPESLGQLTNLTELWLHYNQLTSVPESLGRLTNLTSLGLFNNPLASVPEFLGRLTNLTTLNLGGNQLTTVPEFLGWLTNLTTLNLYGNQLTSVPKSFGQLTRLARLGLHGVRLETLHDWLSQLTNLTTLSLSDNQLTSVPEFLGQLTNLTELWLHDNQLTSVPESLGQLTNLTELSLGSDQLRSVPESLGQLTNLTSLELYKNQLTALPESVGQLTNLTTLDLSDNRLTSVPESLGRLTNLTSLNLNSNRLTTVPESLGRLTNLTELNLGSNQLTSVPESLGRLTNLTSLGLYSNPLASVPESLGRLTNLTKLYLNYNELASVPESLGQLTNLTELSLGSDQLRSVPESLGRLTNLTWLKVSGTQLTSVPESLGRLTNLTKLWLHDNQLTSVPESLGRLTNLTSLNLNSNRLTSVPESLGQLTNLTSLELYKNQLTSVPESLGRLTNLTKLWLHDNQLTAVPESLSQLSKLERLFLHGNPALGIPSEILGPLRDDGRPDWNQPATPKSILDFYFRVVRGSRPLNEGKVILVGRGEVGKTSLVKRLVHDEFTLGEAITHGIHITRYPLDLTGGEVTLHVWDFGGQEIMHGTHQFFLTERSLYLLVLNGRAGDARQEAEYWMQMIRSYGGDSPVLVVLNKQGQHPFDVDRQALTQRFPQIKGFVRTDCQDATGIAELEDAIAREVDALPNLRARFPKSWFAIKDRLSGMTENFIGYDRFGAICDELGEKDPVGQESLAAVLHVLGIALNYRDDPRLNDTHVLNPQWVTGGIYSVVTAPLVAEQHGILNPGDLAKILDARAYPRGMHRYLTDLMRKFDVCFAVPDDSGKLLVPNLLDVAEPAGVPALDPARSLNFEYRYVVLPEGLLPRFIARTHWHSEGQPRWRSGVVLAFDGCEAVVRADTVGRKVTIRVAGPAERRRSLLTIVRSEFDRLHREFKANPPEAWVPLPGHPDHAVEFAELEALEREGETSFEKRIDGQRRKFAVAELLSGLGVTRTVGGRTAKRVFVSYSHRDETHKAVLVGYLAQMIQEGLITWWDDRHLRPTDDWAGEIDRHLNAADVILLLTSKSFLASKYCTEIEVPRAIHRRDTEGTQVVPIFLDDADLRGQPFMARQGLPTDAKPILSAAHWLDPNDAWRHVADGLRRLMAGSA